MEGCPRLFRNLAMTFDEVRDLMKKTYVGFLATQGEGRPAVRPLGAWAWVDGEVWILTGADSAKCRELAERPGAEMCFWDGKGVQVRIAGPCTASDEVEDKRRLFAEAPHFEKVAGPAESKEWTVLRLAPEQILLSTTPMTGYERIDLP